MTEKKFDQNAYKAEFNKANYDRIELRIPKGKKAEWTARAKAEGMSLTAWITKKVEGENNMYPYEPAPNPELISTEVIKGVEYKIVKSYDITLEGAMPFYKILKNGCPLVRRDTKEECTAIIEEIRQA